MPKSILLSLLNFDTPPEFLILFFWLDWIVRPEIVSFINEPFDFSYFFDELLKIVVGADGSFLADAGTTREAAFAMLEIGGFFLLNKKFYTLLVCRPTEEELPSTKVLFFVLRDGFGGRFKTLFATIPE